MAKLSLKDQFNQAVDAIIAHPDSVLPPVDPKLNSLLRLAMDLRDLPDQEFKKQLKTSLQERSRGMSYIGRESVSFIREGFRTVTPYLIVNEAAELIEFVKKVFDAEELFRTIGSGGGIHAEVRIGDSILMIGGGGEWRGTPTPTAIHLFVRDTDAFYRRAVEAGATTLQEPIDTPYGERVCGVTDLAGNQWYIATSLETGYIATTLHNANVYFHPENTAKFIDFLIAAFGATEQARYTDPNGVVVHAKIQIGDAIVEMGEAHGPYHAMPTTLYLYVENVDALHRRALDAGATLLTEPADQPYGDRVGGVTDPFGNTWYIATHIQEI